MDVFSFLNFYSQDDAHRFREIDDYFLKTNFARTTTFKNTYFNRIGEMWNSIPLDIRFYIIDTEISSRKKDYVKMIRKMHYPNRKRER